MEKNTKHTQTGPGKAYRKGLTLVDVIRMFPDDQTAEAWIAGIRWPTARVPPLRARRCVASDGAQDDAVSVPREGVPQVVLGAHRHGDAQLKVGGLHRIVPDNSEQPA